MKRNHHYIFALLLCIFTLEGYAQHLDMGFYHFKSVPQVYQTNPANVPDCKWYIGFPLLSSIYADFGHTGFTPGAVMKHAPGNRTKFSQSDLLDALNGKNHIFVDYSQEWLAFGFRSSMNYFHFSFTEKFLGRFTYPREFIEYLVRGNGSNQFFNNPDGLSLDGFNADMAHYKEMAFTFTSFMNPRFTLGARPKFLFGAMNVITKRNNIKQITDTFSLKFESDLLVNTCLPQSVHDENAEFNFGEYFFNMQNFGIGMDIGANYKYNEKIDLSLSFTDFGFISFRSNPYHYKSKENAKFEFTGLDLASAFSDSTTNFNGLLDDLTDSISNIFEIDDDDRKPYNWGLIPKIYLGGTYRLGDNNYAGLLIRSEFYSSTIHPGFTLSYHHKFGNVLNVTGSYTIINDCYTNFGLGFSLQLGPWQLYCLTDNIVSPFVYNTYKWTETKNNRIEEHSVTAPAYWKNINAHFGMNFKFGYKRIKEVSVPSMK